MKVWISKYALSDGIKHGEAKLTPHGYADVTGFCIYFRLGTEAHETREAAVQAAEAMRQKKIASLKKQIAKLEAMKFEE